MANLKDFLATINIKSSEQRESLLLDIIIAIFIFLQPSSVYFLYLVITHLLIFPIIA